MPKKLWSLLTQSEQTNFPILLTTQDLFDHKFFWTHNLFWTKYLAYHPEIGYDIGNGY